MLHLLLLELNQIGQILVGLTNYLVQGLKLLIFGGQHLVLQNQLITIGIGHFQSLVVY
jgi:hypothetical protein